MQSETSDPIRRLIEDWEVEQHDRWKGGDRVLLESFLDRHPKVAANAGAVAELIESEIWLRASLGPVPELNEYLRRFPAASQTLHMIFGALAAQVSLDNRTLVPRLSAGASTVPRPKTSESSDASTPADPYATQPLSTRAPGSSGQRFHIVRPHARGGLGVVFVAVDEELNREVALKEIQDRYADHLEFRARFVSEAEITGGLEHPGIVPVYGLGRYADGRPFYAMRFIRGESLQHAITQFHQKSMPARESGERVLDLRKLLTKMIAVCDAIEYAHSRKVLHRDLKPANIMVGKFGETLVVDWGLAKAMGGTQQATIDAERPLQVSSTSGSQGTRMGSTVGTIQYMSPEQAAGRLDMVSPAIDIYCLGSTLYHLLTGRPPIDKADSGAMLQQAQLGSFPAPRAVQPDIPRPLEAICLKAMAREPAQRYSSARHLADDIEHWMADEPVLAYPENKTERAGRWLRKHRSWARAMAAALLIVSTVSLLAAIFVNQARRNEAEQREIAEAATQDAVAGFKQARESMDTWLTGAGEVLRYYPNMQHVRRALLQQAEVSYKNLAQRRDDVGLQIERGRAQQRLGDVQRQLGDARSSERAYRESAETFERLIAAGESVRECQLDRASAQVKLGLLMSDLGQIDEADRQYVAAIDQLRSLTSESAAKSSMDRARETLAAALVNHAALQYQQSKIEQAIQSLRQALTELSPLAAAEPTTRQRLSIATANSMWGQCLLGQGSYQVAIEKLERAMSDLKPLAHDPAAGEDYVQLHGEIQLLLANAYRFLGKYDAELACYRSSIANYQTLDKLVQRAPSVQEALALTRTDMALLLYHMEETSLAEFELKLALPIFVDLEATYPDTLRFREEEAVTQDTLGEVLRDQAHFEQSQAAHRHAIQIYDALVKQVPEVGDYDLRRAICRSHLGQVLLLVGARDGAAAELRGAMATLEALSPQSVDIIDATCLVRTHLGLLLLEEGDPASATALFQKAQAAWKILLAEKPSAELQNRLAWQLVSCPIVDLRDGPQAATLAQQAVQESPQNPFYLATLAAARLAQGDVGQALELLGQVQALRGNLRGREWFLRAMALAKTGHKTEADDAMRSGEQWTREHLPGNAELKRLQNEAKAAIESR